MTRLSILIVDDDVMVAALLAETLEINGHFICGMETTEAGAVSAAERERPDLVIIDVTLGAGSGIQAMEQILRFGPVAHVLISGRADPAGREVLLKPFREAGLLQAISVALSRIEVA